MRILNKNYTRKLKQMRKYKTTPIKHLIKY